MTEDPQPVADDRPPDAELENLLVSLRAIPAPRFRGALGRYLAAEDPGYGPRPDHLWRKVALWLAGGGVLIAIGALRALGAL